MFFRNMSRNVGVLGQMSEINDHLYLSGAGVLKPDKIKQRKINMIVNATTEEPSTYMQGSFEFSLKKRKHPNPPAIFRFSTKIRKNQKKKKFRRYSCPGKTINYLFRINFDKLIPISGVDTMKIRIEDHPYARLSEHFDVVADKIRNVKVYFSV